MFILALRRVLPVVVAAGFLSAPGPVRAGNHYLKPVANQGVLYWDGAMSVEGPGVELMGEELDFNEPGNPFSPLQVVLYRGLTKVTVKASFNFLGGADVVPGSVTVNGAPGEELTQTLDLTDPSTNVVYGGWFVVRATTVAEGPGGEPVYGQIENSFYARLEVHKTLAVALRNTGSTGAVLVTFRQRPNIQLDETTGVHSIVLTKEEWGPAAVTIEPTGDLQIAEAGDGQTGDNGQLVLSLFADVDLHGGGAGVGWISGSFRFRASRDGCEAEGTGSVSIPFAMVTAAQNAQLVIGDGIGETFMPLYSPYPLNADDKVQVGSATSGAAYLGIRFANGQSVTLAAEPFQGFRAVIGGADSIETGPSLLSLKLKSALQSAVDDPRRVGRMAVYKAAGNLVDGALGVPGKLGWVTTTPGGAVEEHLAEWGEPAYGGPSPQALPMTAAESADGPMAEAPPEMPMAVSTRTEFEFYTDGSVWVEQIGGGSVQITGTGGTQRIGVGGATLVRNGQPGAASTSTRAANAPAPGSITLGPVAGTVVTTRTPALSVQIPAFAAVSWETLSVRLDGVEIGHRFPAHGDGTSSWTPGVTEALGAGSHVLSARIQTSRGTSIEASSNFSVAAAPAVASDVRASACPVGVWLVWTPPATDYPVRFEVWRQPSSGDPAARIAENLAQPGAFDPTPLASASYTVRTVDPAGGTSADASPVAVVWSASLPPAPAPAPVDPPTLSAVPGGVGIRFRNRSGTWGRFRLERGGSDSGPFVDLHPGDPTVREETVDRTVLPGGTYYYRVVSLGPDGTGGGTTVAGPVTVPESPAAPGALRVHTVTGAVPGARLAWDPVDDPGAAGIRVYRDAGSGFEPIADLAATAGSHFDATYPPGGAWRYRVASVRSDGVAGPAGSIGGAAVHAVAENPAQIGFGLTEFITGEGEGQAGVILTRGGNLSEPAVIGYRAETWWDDQAHAPEDYTPVRGWAVFAPGETQKTVPVPLMQDSAVENDELFSFAVFGVLGATVPGPEGRTRVRIQDQDVILPHDYVSELTVMENQGSVVVPLMRIYPSNRTVSVAVAVVPAESTAAEGTDYGPFSSGRVEFAPGATLGNLSIPLRDDAVRDGHRVLMLRLQEPLGGCGISEWSQTVRVTIRDDETHAGQMRFDVVDRVVVAPRGGNLVVVPVVRAGGTDGAISAFAMMGGGSIPHEALVGVSGPAPLAEGEAATEVTVEVDPALFDARRAPFLIIDLMNSEYPHETSQVVVVFPRLGGPGNGFADWVAGWGLPAGTAFGGDHDRDGGSELVEFALGTSPLDGGAVPEAGFAFDEWGGFGLRRWVRADPDLVVYAEFSDAPGGSSVQLRAGFVEWPGTPDGGAIHSFTTYSGAGQGRMFGRLRMLWVSGP